MCRVSHIVALLVHVAAPAVAEPLAVFEAREITGRDWPRTLVTYQLEAKASGRQALDKGIVKLTKPFQPGSAKLVDMASGAEVPYQAWKVKKARDGSIASARISFYAALPAGGSYRFELVPGAPAAAPSLPTAKVDGGLVTLDNGITAIRLPAGRRTFEKPLRFAKDHAEAAAAGLSRLAEQGLAFGPVAGVRLNDGTWIGGSYFTYEPIEVVRKRQGYLREVPAAAWARAANAAPQVTACETVVTEQGALFVEARTRFELSNGGHYQLTARVLAGDAAVRIDEESQLKSNCPPDDPIYVDMVLASGAWQPDAFFAFGGKSEKVAGLDQALLTQGFKPTMSHLPVAYDGGVVADLIPTMQWSQRPQLFGLVAVSELAAAKTSPWKGPLLPMVDTAKLDGAIPILAPGGTTGCPTPDARFIAVVPQHAGSWRQAHWVFPPKSPHMFQQLFAFPDGQVAMRWTIRPQPHSQNLLQTGEFDPDFGLMGMRRLWNLVAGPFQYTDTLLPMRAYEGYVSLDAYKNWPLAWSDDTRAGVKMPVPPPASRLRGPLWHLGMSLRAVIDGCIWFSHYRQAQFSDWAGGVEKHLADPTLPPEEKGQLRAQVAAFCCLMADPDFNMRASMLHQGNPNMPINRFMALPYAARLIPDHPLTKRWMDVADQYLAYKMGMNTAPGGAWSELVTYYSAGRPVEGALAVRQVQPVDPATLELCAEAVKFRLDLLTPIDPRYAAAVDPGFGHEGVRMDDNWRNAVALLAATKPDLAKAFAWAWKRQGEPFGDEGFQESGIDSTAVGALADQATPDLLGRTITSSWIPGAGGSLRAFATDPNETFLALRQGFFHSHSDPNQGDFVIYAKGAPLTTMSIYGYAIWGLSPDYQNLDREFGWQSRVRFGQQKDRGGFPGGGAVSDVHRHFFSGSVDYLKGLGDYSVMHPKPDDWDHPDLTSPETERWTRQILMLKGKTPTSPTYFVFRDSFRNKLGDAEKLAPTWWYQRVLGTKEQVQAGDTGFEFASEFGGVKMNTHFLQPAKVQVESRTGYGKGAQQGSNARNWAKVHGPKALAEEWITVNAAGPIPAGQDVLVAVVPRGKDEPEPKYESLADGVARITTTESTDHVFAGVDPVSFKQGDVTFEGMAGAIRVYPDAVHLVIAEGAGTATYKGYTLEAGKPVTKVVPLAEIAKGGTVKVPADPVSITFALSGAATEVTPGVRMQQTATGVAYAFDAQAPLAFEQDGVVFQGRRGGIVVDEQAGTTRLVMLDGDRIGFKAAQASESSGPYDLTFHRDKVVGVTEGPARFIHVTMPEGIVMLPAVNIKGVRYAPGTYGSLAIVPVYAGRFEFTLENLPQPPVFRDWVRW